MRRIKIVVGVLLLSSGFALADTVQPAAPVDRPLPVYPEAAGYTEGSVTLRFGIGADGHVKDDTVIDSSPKSLFDQAALDAVSHWLYRPRTSDGKPVDQLDNEVVLRFKPEARQARKLLYAPPPGYSRGAYEARLEGVVTVAFEVNAAGLTENVRVVESTLPGVFDEAAVRSISGWNFEPAGPNIKVPVPTPMTVKVPFKLSDAHVAPKPVHLTKPIYPALAERAGVIGGCNLEFIVEPDGSVGDAKINTCFPSGYFEQASLAALKMWTFEPARSPSGPIAMPAYYAINFRMRGQAEALLHYMKAGQWIRLRFTLTERGYAKDVEVIEKSDDSVDERQAKQQLLETRMSPIVENGQAVEKPDQEIRIIGK
jgi:TonB family protein